MNQTLESIARVIFRSWFVDFDPVRAKAEGRDPGLPPHLAALFPDRFEGSEMGNIPAAWRGGVLGDEFNLMMGQSPPGSTYNEDGEGLPFYQGRVDFGFRFPHRRVYCTAPTRIAAAGDTLVTVRAPVGDINKATEPCCIGRGVAAVRHKTGSESYSYYSMQFLKSVFDRFEAEGTVFGSINRRGFYNLEVLRPPTQVILAFDNTVSSIDRKIEVIWGQVNTLAALRDTLLPRLLSGELRVGQAERILAGAVS